MKKVKFTLFGKIFFIIIFVLLIFLGFNYLKKDEKNINIKNNYDDLNLNVITKDDNQLNQNQENIVIDFIVDSEESDRNIIKQQFADGMNLEEFKKIYTQKENYMDKKDKYKKIDYNFEEKIHYSQIEDMIINMNNSDICNVEIIGNSVDNRKIYGIEIGKGDKVIFLDSNMHAAEIANTLILVKFMSEIINDYESGNTDVINALNNVKLAIIACDNPDMYELYNYGPDVLRNKDLWVYQKRNDYNLENIKCNANGVDLNRNFPTQNAAIQYTTKNFIKSVALEKTTSNDKYFGGSELGSEPETRAMMYFILKHYKNMKYYINMHSQGRVIYAGKPNLSNEFNNNTQKFAKSISNINGYTVHGLSSEEVGEGNDGSVTDFVAELANGFKFSSKTLRLSTDKYINNNCKLENDISVITLETTRTYTTDVNVFKNEYYKYNLRKVLYNLLNM